MKMSEDEIRQYTETYQKKLQARLAQKRRQLKEQQGYANNPDGMQSPVSKIKRRQWYSAFEYHTLVGVDLRKDEEAKKIADKQIQNFEEKYQIGKYD